MNKNTFSLLSSNWMFANNSGSSLYPFLFAIINGSSYVEASLPATESYFMNVGGLKSAYGNEGILPDAEAVAVLKIHHPIFKYDQNCGPKGTQSIMAMMEGWKNEASIKGVVIDFNSGGGQVTGTAEFAEYIYNYPKPVVAFTKDTIGSAAYHMASPADSIIAHKHADFIGCIGTMMQSVNIEGVLVKKGATINELYSDLSPEKNKQSRALKKGDSRPMIEEILNPMAQQFQDDVKLYRPMISEKALKGDIFTPKQALKEGLIDEIGTLQTAIDKVFELSKTNKNQNNFETMNKKFTRVQAALGMEANFESNENGVFVSEEQLEILETAFETQETAIAGATIAGDTAITAATDPLNATISTLADEGVEVTAAIDAALTEAEVDRGTMTNAQAVAHLSGLVTEYGKKDGAKPTAAITEADATNNGIDNVIGGIDITAAMNN